MNFFDELFPEKDGAMQISRMGFMVPVPGGEVKDHSERSTVVWVIVGIVVTVLISIMAISTWLGAKKQEQAFEHIELLEASIGQTQETVSAVLVSKGAGLVETAPKCYLIPGEHEFAGVEFAILLYFDENEGLMDGFAYKTSAKLEPKKAAQAIKAMLGEYYTDSVTLTDGRKIPLGTKTLTDLLTGDEPFVLRLSADITPKPEYGTAVARYITHLEAADYWEGRSGEYLIKTANYYRDIDVRYTPQTQTLLFNVNYSIEADRD